MTGTVSGIERARRYRGNDQWEELVMVKILPDEGYGYASVPYPATMESLFPLGKRVELTVSELRSGQAEVR